MFVEPVQYLLRRNVVLELDHDAHAFAVGFVAQIADALDLFVLCKLGNRLDELGLVDLIRDFRDDNIELAAIFFLHDLRLRAGHDPATSGNIGFLDRFHVIDDAAGRKIRAFYELQKVLARGVLVVR